MSRRRICEDTSNITFSQALEAGLTHSGSLDGRMTDLSRRDLALASHSASPDLAAASRTSVTYGPLFGGLSPSDAFQLSLGNRLRARMAGCGSILYRLTWKVWDMPSGRRICALRASARRTSANDFTGWPTPTVANAKGSQSCAGMSATGRMADGRKVASSLPHAARLAGWSTPVASDAKRGMAGSSRNRGPGKTLTEQVSEIDKRRRLTVSGEMLTGSSARMSGGDRLNPAHSRWLMGYLPDWDESAVTAMRSLLKSRRSSS